MPLEKFQLSPPLSSYDARAAAPIKLGLFLVSKTGQVEPLFYFCGQ